MNDKIKTIETFIPVTRYITTDGRSFEDEDKAKIHQLRLDGKCKDCVVCEGTGKLPDAEYRIYYKCTVCDGKGFLVKTEVWM